MTRNAAAGKLGISMLTLANWEKKEGFPKIERSLTGRFNYTERNLEEIIAWKKEKK